MPRVEQPASQPSPRAPPLDDQIEKVKFIPRRLGSFAVFLKVAGWQVSGGFGLFCGGKNLLGQAVF